jgi:glycosyltransferase involved in cell wall biosynthesis
MNGISIIVPTRNVPNFLKECIESIKKQVVNFEYEIIIGVDNCEKTVQHIQTNPEFYNDITVYSFFENVGPYIIKNNLIDYCKYNTLLFFDSDDIMVQNMLQTVHNTIKTYDVIQFKYVDFRGDIRNQMKGGLAEGIIGIKKDIFIENGGFENWICAADSEFRKRLLHRKINMTLIPNIMIYRRLHENNLTISEQTNFKSIIRKKYAEEIKEREKNKSWTNPIKLIKEHIKIK